MITVTQMVNDLISFNIKKSKTINKSYKNKEHVPSKPTLTIMREKGTENYENAHTQAVALELLRRRHREPSTLRMFCRLKACVYKKGNFQCLHLSEVGHTNLKTFVGSCAATLLKIIT